MTRDEWIESADTRRQGFLRPGTIPLYGSGGAREHGSKVSPTAYPNQGLDLATEPYDWHWQRKARIVANISRGYGGPIPGNGRAGECKRVGLAQFTPLGTSVAELTRTGGDMLASPCGYCGVNISKCRCGQGGTENHEG